VIQIEGAPRAVISEHTLDRMTDAMTHRGPNDRGTYLAAGMALGARRLSIVDVGGGHQPVSSEDGRVWAIQNGELYNHEELRRSLAGHAFRSRCDTEILPHLYERDGSRFVERLRGKFAIAVWDETNRRAVLARDRLGVKPLYYARCGDVLVFGSEMKSVLASGLVDDALDFEAIDAYLHLGFFPQELTPLAAVRKLLPGHVLIVEDGTVRIEQYWAYPEPAVEPEPVSEQEWAERLIAELETAVRLRLMSDVPLGAMLSGGLDSSLIVALMARNMTEPVKTFSVGFREDGQGSELADARFIADYFGTDHHELELSFERDTVDLTNLVWHLDEPVADLSSLGLLALSGLAAQYVTVALSGQGADELLGGYRKHRAAALVERFQSVPRVARSPIEAVLRRSAGQVGRVLAARDPVGRQLAMSGRLDADGRRRLASGALAALDGHAAERAVSRALGGARAGVLATTLHLDAKLALVDLMLHYFDRASMAHSLEVRVPFLDHHVVELCARIPSDLKVRGLTTKFLLKRAACDLVPTRIVEKRKIGFFHSAVEAWFRTHAEGAVRNYLLDPGARSAEFLDRTEIGRLVNGSSTGRGQSNPRLLLAVLMLEVWLRTYLPRARSLHNADARPPALASR
jgi:asparagine synthase (glutamine-hydrolysing)